jgi:hypothetical protein
MSKSRITGRTCFPLRLNRPFRWALYAAYALLLVTGAAWLVADWQKSISREDFWQWGAAWLLMLHGGGAMVTLLLLGALMPVHSYRAWRSRRNRLSGGAMLTLNAMLIATSFGLYYTGSEWARPLMSDVHIIVGFFLPILFASHIMLGRRTRPP